MLRRTAMTPKPAKCKHCRKRLERVGQRIHDDCVGPWYEANEAKLRDKTARRIKRMAQEARKLEKAQDKERKEKLKTYTDREEECRRIVQKIARLRDRHDGCISCHMGPNYGGQWHGSHFRPAGNHGSVQFSLWNIHKACAQCNLFKGGNQAQYRPRLVEKIGADKVDWLESQNQPVKHNAEYMEYLIRFKAVMGKRLRRMEKRIGNES